MRRPTRKGKIRLVIVVVSFALVVASFTIRWSSNDTTGSPNVACKQPPSSAHPPDGAHVQLILSVNEAKPGEEITMTIGGPQSTKIIRGLSSYLECWDGSQWMPRFVLIAGNGSISSAIPFEKHPIVPSIGLDGPGPDKIRLPEVVQPGLYRIRKTVSLTIEGQSSDHTLHALIEIPD